jgi:hypothetical protein
MSSISTGAIASVPGDRPQKPAEEARAHFRRPGEKLDEDVARQLPLEILARRVGDIAIRIVQRLMVALRLVGQHDQMHERIGMDDDEQDGRESEEGDQRQLDVEERQLDRMLEEKILMRHRTGGDCDIEKGRDIGQPEATADRYRVVDRLLERLQIVGIRRNRWKVRFVGDARRWRRRQATGRWRLGRRWRALALIHCKRILLAPFRLEARKLNGCDA